MGDDSGTAIARQWAMLRAIPRSPQKATTGEIESRLRDEGFEVSRRTIERDLHTLSAQFPLVLDDRSKPYGWSWAKDANFEFMPRLTSPQAVALLLAQMHLSRLLPDALRKDLQPAFETAEQTLASSGWKDWHRQTAMLPTGLSLIPPRVPADVLSCVGSALARRRCIRANYRTKGSRDTREMLIHPLGMLARGPVLYLVCTLFDYEDVRQLALHRLTDPKEIGETAKRPKDFNFQHYAKETAPNYLSKGRIRLVARFDGPAAEHLSETPLSTDQTWKDLRDGRVEISASVEDDETLRWWILGFGSQIEIHEPSHLRDWIIQELHLASQTYTSMDQREH